MKEKSHDLDDIMAEKIKKRLNLAFQIASVISIIMGLIFGEYINGIIYEMYQSGLYRHLLASGYISTGKTSFIVLLSICFVVFIMLIFCIVTFIYLFILKNKHINSDNVIYMTLKQKSTQFKFLSEFFTVFLIVLISAIIFSDYAMLPENSSDVNWCDIIITYLKNKY